jgi:hypothetical protein
MPPFHPDVTAISATNRSRVTNGSALLSGVDGRSPWARRLRDLIALHVSDLGGRDAVSTAELSIVRRAATLTVELERIEARLAAASEAGDANDAAATAADLGMYVTTSNALRRLLETVGLQRRAKDVTPDIKTYLAELAKRRTSVPAAPTEEENRA